MTVDVVDVVNPQSVAGTCVVVVAVTGGWQFGTGVSITTIIDSVIA